MTSPVISPTVARFECVLTRNENNVEPENGVDVKYTNGSLLTIKL